MVLLRSLPCPEDGLCEDGKWPGQEVALIEDTGALHSPTLGATDSIEGDLGHLFKTKTQSACCVREWRLARASTTRANENPALALSTH